MALATKSTITKKFNPDGARYENGSYPVRAALVATTSYVDTDHAPCEGAPWMAFIVTVDDVDYTSLQLIVEGSLDGSAWYQLPIDGAATAVPVTYTLATVLKDAVSAHDGAFRALVRTPTERYVRASVKRTGGTAVGTVAIAAVPGVKA